MQNPNASDSTEGWRSHRETMDCRYAGQFRCTCAGRAGTVAAPRLGSTSEPGTGRRFSRITRRLKLVTRPRKAIAWLTDSEEQCFSWLVCSHAQMN